MGTIADFKRGDLVSFRPGRASYTITAKVTGKSDCKLFLVTKDEAGVVRKTRPGSCTKVS